MQFSQLFVVLRRVDHNLLVILVFYICYGMCGIVTHMQPTCVHELIMHLLLYIPSLDVLTPD